MNIGKYLFRKLDPNNDNEVVFVASCEIETSTFINLLELQDFQDILNTQVLDDSDVRIVQLMEVVAPSQYCIFDKFKQSYEVVPVSVTKYFSSGYSIVINKVERFLRNVSRLCIDICQVYPYFVEDVFVNCYLTPKGFQGFPIHYDSQDVIVYQAKGKKTWNIYGRVLNDPYASTDTDFLHDDLGDCETYEMTEGDILFIPAGIAHEAICMQNNSIHLSFSIVPVLKKTSVKNGIRKAIESISGLSGPIGKNVAHNDLQENLTELVHYHCPTSEAEQLQNTALSRLQLLFEKFDSTAMSDLYNMEEQGALKHNYRKCVVSSLVVEASDEEGIMVDLPSGLIRLPNELKDFVFAINSRKAFNPAQYLENIETDSAVGLLKLLVTDGIIKIDEM
jgi:hypothetical protein